MAESKQLQPVNFTVGNISEVDDPSKLLVEISFDGSDKTYGYKPIVYKDGKCQVAKHNGRNYMEQFVRVSGCYVYFIKIGKGEYKVTRIVRYENVRPYGKGRIKSGNGGKKAAKPRQQQRPPKLEQKPEPEEQQPEPRQQPEEEQLDGREKLRRIIEKRKQEQAKKEKAEHPELDAAEKEAEQQQPEPEPKDEWDVPDKSWKEQVNEILDSDKAVFLSGPAGCGKNYLVEEIATERDWEFYSTNAVTQEYKLLGFVDAMGSYQQTELYKACTSDVDCIFFLDEMDASDAQALVTLNAAIANGYLEFPCGRVDIKHVHWIAAGNTTGDGADELYTGRTQIDKASLDRFGFVECGYEYEVEVELAEGDTDLVDLIEEVRKVAEQNGVRATFSYRCIMGVSALKGKLNRKQALKIWVLKGIDKDTARTLRVWDGGGKWADAWNELIAA